MQAKVSSREMEEERGYRAHVVVLPFHGLGHINPMFQLSKRLASKGLKITVATTVSSMRSMQAGGPGGSITFEPIYDDCIEGGLGGPGWLLGFMERFKASAERCLPDLVKNNSESYPVKCLVYDANLPWALNIAKQLGVSGVAFFTQSCAAIASYYPMYMDMCDQQLPVPAFSMPGLRQPDQIPSCLAFGSDAGRYHPIIRIILDQFSNIDKADWILFNSFDKLEEEVIKWMANIWPVVRTIGPTVPSFYLDKRVKDDIDYGFNLNKPNCETCMTWLNTKKPGSVVYISFGSTAAILNAEQMTEMTWALRQTSSNFLWVVKANENGNLPNNFVEKTSGKGLVVEWCPQLEVLAHPAIGCFITHCGWNSTVEAISFGVPMVGMPQFLDQMSNAYFLGTIWGVGVQTKVNEKGLSSRGEIDRCISEVMQGERGQEIKKNAMLWKTFAKEAVDEGGSSDKYINEIIARLVGT